ncbi:hypothetical protein LC653_41465 [Nostoc sp. CHAB 5784]|uniref:hypothetical protein n=1 Tax=Nostoc mirabile TaxID=2907820 RepID=UPI001E4CDDC1|nr:hypothetical protein [Nostoc mirabile]MCC5670094.1 hypothetical protein [Nostoc mirabile CHAB5784]
MRIRRETSGEVATYRIISIYGQFDYLVTLDHLRELLWDLVGRLGLPSWSHHCLKARYAFLANSSLISHQGIYQDMRSHFRG